MARKGSPVRRGAHLPTTVLESRFGQFVVTHFTGASGATCLIIRSRDLPSKASTSTVRLHSSCLFGEALSSEECDCGQQLSAALKEISLHGGALIYMFDEGRSVGLPNKIRSMEFERIDGISTAAAFARIGYAPDPRRYEVAVEAIRSLNLGRNIRLISNNPAKLKALTDAGFAVLERVEPRLRLTRHALSALRRKEKSLDHIPYKNVTVVDK